MKKILLRSGKDPFQILSPEYTLDKNTLGTNSGNLIFAHAAHKLLSTSGTSVTSNHYQVREKDADKINEQYDAFVVPLANAFRESFRGQLNSLTKLIRKLKIPVVILGVGAQSNVAYDLSKMSKMNDAVKAFVSAVLDKSASIGVRGEFTYNYLKSLGFDAVDMIGCPSMFLHGDKLSLRPTPTSLTADSKFSINVSPYLGTKMGSIFQDHVKRYPNLYYVPQDTPTLEAMMWGETWEEFSKTEPMPIHLSHQVFRENRTRYFIDPAAWFEFLSGCDFAFGTRIHGNITALLAGTPAYIFAHDSRTLELARYFEIPHTILADVPDNVDVNDLLAKADYSKMLSGHKARFDNYIAFVEKNGLDHVFKPNNGGGVFDTMIADTKFPPAVEVAGRDDRNDIVNRLRYVRNTHARRMHKIEDHAKDLAAKVDKLGKAG